MYFKILLYFILSGLIISCGTESDQHNHSSEDDQAHAHAQDDQTHAHEDIKLQFSSYTNKLELFAEADPFVQADNSIILAHFTKIDDFKALDKGTITASLKIGNKIVAEQKSDKWLRPGIIEFVLKPEFSGMAKLQFEVKSENISDTIIIEDLTIYKDEEEAYHAENIEVDEVNTTSFTKEQSWKVKFKTELPQVRSFGKVVKAIGQVETPQCEELIITSKNNGTLTFNTEHLNEGKVVNIGQKLFSISSENFVDDNLSIRLSEKENDLNEIEQNLERIRNLFDKKLITKAELLEVTTEYRNTKLELDNLKKNYTKGGSPILSPMNGYVKKLLVKNGQFVNPGEAMIELSSNTTILIRADVDLSDASILHKIKSLTIHNMQDDSYRQFLDLNSSVLTIGKQTNNENFMIPFSIELDNIGRLIPGSFVELYIQTENDEEAIVIPNSSLLEEEGKYYVYVQLTPELFEKRYVNKGNSDGSSTQILEGISHTDRIVSEGAIYVKLAQPAGVIDAHAGHVH